MSLCECHPACRRRVALLGVARFTGAWKVRPQFGRPVGKNEWQQPPTKSETSRHGVPVGEAVARRRRSCENRIRVSHKKGLQRDLEGGKGTQRMLVERGQQMSECEFGWLPGRDLGRPAQGAQRGADRALGLVKSLPDAVGCGIAQSAFEASESLQLIAGEDGLLEKRPQAVGGQEESPDFISHPHAEGSSAAGGPIAIVAENTPRADCFPTQLLLVIAPQKAVPDQASDLFAMRTSRNFQLVEHLFDFLFGTTNPATHDSLTKREPLYGANVVQILETPSAAMRGGVGCMKREAGCGDGLQGAGCGGTGCGVPKLPN